MQPGRDQEMVRVTGARGSRWPKFLARAFAVVSVAAVVVVVWRALPEIRESAGALLDFGPGLVLVVLLLEAAAVACLPQVYRTSVEALGERVAYRDALQVSMGAFTISRILPGGGAAGGVFAARRLTRLGIGGPAATLAVGLEGVLAMVTLGAIVALGSGVSALRGIVPGIYAVIVLAVTACFAAVLVAGRMAMVNVRVRERLLRVVDRFAGRRVDVAALRETVVELAVRLPDGRLLLPIVAWSAANWGLDIAALWVAFAGLGHAIPVGVLLIGFAAANLLTAFPHTPGGLGVVEVGMAATYIAFDIPAATAIAGVLGYRLIAYWLPVLAGVPQYFRSGRLTEPAAAQ